MKIRVLISIAMLLPLCAAAQSLDDLKSLVPSDAVINASESLGGSMSGILQNQAEDGIGSMLTLGRFDDG